MSERRRIREGDRVELLFLFRGQDKHGIFIQSERLWVTVRTAGSGGYTGILESAPVSSKLVDVGDSIPFELHHVENIKRRHNESPT